MGVFTKDLTQSRKTWPCSVCVQRTCRPDSALGYLPVCCCVYKRFICLFILKKGLTRARTGLEDPSTPLLQWTRSLGAVAGNLFSFHVSSFPMKSSYSSSFPLCSQFSLGVLRDLPQRWVILLPNDGLSSQLKPSQTKQGLKHSQPAVSVTSNPLLNQDVCAVSLHCCPSICRHEQCSDKNWEGCRLLILLLGKSKTSTCSI